MKGERERWSHSSDWRVRRMAGVLANRWVRSPGLTSVAVDLRSLQAAMLGRCLRIVGGRLVMGATRMVDGRPVVVLRNVGDRRRFARLSSASAPAKSSPGTSSLVRASHSRSSPGSAAAKAG